MDLDQIRREYLSGGLRRDNLCGGPLEQFSIWLKNAIDSGVHDPTAMILATVDKQGCPNQRIVLLKHFDQHGFVFFTNYNSFKGEEITSNNKVCLHFPWHVMDRQVRVQGTIEKTTKIESEKYFASRPYESQIAAWASNQSTKIDSRASLEQQFANMKEKFSPGDVSLPEFWGGYRVSPKYIEFWQGGANRLHDRFEYRLKESGHWEINRLAP